MSDGRMAWNDARLAMIGAGVGGAARRAGRWLWGMGERLLEWSEREGQRRALRGLDARMLSDIGIGRAEAEAEADKPFWRA